MDGYWARRGSKDKDAEDTKSGGGDERRGKKRTLSDRLGVKPRHDDAKLLAEGVPHEIHDLEENVVKEGSDEELGSMIAARLNEPNEEIIHGVINVIGRDVALSIFSKTQLVEAEGGMMIKNGARRKTSGGVFLNLLRETEDPIIDKDKVKKFFNNQHKNEKRKMLNAKLNHEVVQFLKEKKEKLVKGPGVKSSLAARDGHVPRIRSRSPGSRRKRSRSPGGNRCKTPEEPRKKFKREERVRQFIEEERKMRMKLRKRREEYEKEFKDNNYNYSRHQKYSSEYIEFSQRKFGKQWRPKLSELDPDTKKQWRQHWLNILEEEHRESKERKTEELMRKHQIIQRDLDELNDYIEQKDSASKQRTIKFTKYDVTVLGTLRLISAWKNYLDEIGPKANVYLNKALFMESKKQDSSEDLVNEVDFCKMLDASLEKLKYRMGTGVIGESQEKTNCRICINNIAILLQRSTCEKQEILEIGVSKINSSSKETDHEIKKAITQQVFKQHSQQLGERELNLIVEKVYEKLKHPNPAPNDILESLSCGNSGILPPQQAPSLASGQLFSIYSGQQEASQLQPQRPSSNNLQEVDWVNISKIVTQINTGPSQTHKPRHNSGPFQQQNVNLELSQPRRGSTDQLQPINVRTVEQVNKGVGDCNKSAQNTDKSEHDEDDEIQIIEPIKVEQIDPYDELDTDDLVNLLKNFKELERSQQECLLAYMKKLEKNQPDKARRLNFKFRYDPEQDEIYKQVVEVEKKCVEMEKRLAGLEDEVEGITRGHLNKTLHAQALKTLEKKSKSTSEELMRMLEVLDSISLTEDQQECRVKRKSVIGRINKALDHDDRLLLKVSDLIKNSVP